MLLEPTEHYQVMYFPICLFRAITDCISPLSKILTQLSDTACFLQRISAICDMFDFKLIV